MVVLVYFGSQCAKFHAAGWMCWFLHPSIWSRVFDSISRRIRQIVYNTWNKCDRASSMIRQALGGGGGHEPYIESPNSLRLRQAKNKVKGMLIILFEMKGIVHRKFILAGQTVNFAYYCDVLQQLHGNVRRLHFGDKSTGCCIMTTHRLTLSPGKFLPKPTWLSPTHPTFLCFPNWRYNWKATILTTEVTGRIVGGAEHPHETWLPLCI
jgi:hypothetical protein